MILLDTNVVSEPMRAKPDAKVVHWLNNHFPQCAVSSVSIFELRAGAARLPKGKRRDAMEQAVDRSIRRFGSRVYSFDHAAALAAARLFSVARTAGRGAHSLPEHLADMEIAGIAAAHGLTLATRDISHHEVFGLDLVNPWDA